MTLKSGSVQTSLTSRWIAGLISDAWGVNPNSRHSEKTKVGVIISRSTCGSRRFRSWKWRTTGKWVLSKDKRFTLRIVSPCLWAGRQTHSWRGAAGVKSLQPTIASLEWRSTQGHTRSSCQTDNKLCSAVAGWKMKHQFVLDKFFHREGDDYSGCSSRDQKVDTLSTCSWKPTSES